MSGNQEEASRNKQYQMEGGGPQVTIGEQETEGAMKDKIVDLNDFFKELATFEQKFIVTSLIERRQFNKKADPDEELTEVLDNVKDIEGALKKCCQIA